MGIERMGESLYHIAPGPIDVHTHSRVFDAISNNPFVSINECREGKAGLSVYTRVALRCGMAAMILMPNETMRRYALHYPEQTELVPYPPTNNDRIIQVQSQFQREAVIPTGINMTVDPTEIFMPGTKSTRLNKELIYKRFLDARGEVTGVKLYGGETEGGYNVPPEFLPEIVGVLHEAQEGTPVVFHLEDEDVGNVLHAISCIPELKDVPLHIAHVSSRQELAAVIHAKQAGMDVTCEITVHHPIPEGNIKDEIGGYGCMSQH